MLFLTNCWQWRSNTDESGAGESDPMQTKLKRMQDWKNEADKARMKRITLTKEVKDIVFSYLSFKGIVIFSHSLWRCRTRLLGCWKNSSEWSRWWWVTGWERLWIILGLLLLAPSSIFFGTSKFFESIQNILKIILWRPKYL